MAQFSVLGANGFIGGHLVRHLTSLGHTVYTPGRRDRLIFSQSLGNVIYAIGVTADFRTRPIETMEAHVSVLCEILRHSHFKSFTYLSSTRLYGGTESTDESTDFQVNPAEPGDLYNLSKLAGEALCMSHSCDAVRIARLSNVYGIQPPSTAETAQNFLESVVHEAISTGKVILRTALDSAKDYIAIDDVCRALTQIAQHGTERIYNVAAGRNFSHGHLSQALAEQTGCSVEVTDNAPKVEFPVINTERLVTCFKSTGENWTPASLLDRLPYLTASPNLKAANAAGGLS